MEDKNLPKPQRCSGRKLYERLKGTGYGGADDSVQRFIKRWLLEGGKVGDAYVPLSFAPGEAYQFDWSEETVVILQAFNGHFEDKRQIVVYNFLQTLKVSYNSKLNGVFDDYKKPLHIQKYFS